MNRHSKRILFSSAVGLSLAVAPGMTTGTVRPGPPPTILHDTILTPGDAGSDWMSISTRVEGAPAARLEVRLSTPGHPDVFGPCVHEESVGDRVLTFFRFKATERQGRILELSLSGAGEALGRVRIPLDFSTAAGGPAAIVVPEAVPTDRGHMSWTPLEVRVDEGSLQILQVVAEDGRVVATWEPLYLEPGPIRVLWDGRLPSGSSARAGTSGSRPG